MKTEYMDPVFDTSDINNDGLLDNPEMYFITNQLEQDRKLITVLDGVSV